MKRFEIAIEVGPIDPAVVDRLEADGYTVFRGPETWRVQAMALVLSDGVVRAQAHAFALRIIDDYGLTAVTDASAVALRNPDAGIDERPDLLFDDVRQAEDRPPTPRPRRRWYQRAMELGLGERKGD